MGCKNERHEKRYNNKVSYLENQVLTPQMTILIWGHILIVIVKRNLINGKTVWKCFQANRLAKPINGSSVSTVPLISFQCRWLTPLAVLSHSGNLFYFWPFLTLISSLIGMKSYIIRMGYKDITGTTPSHAITTLTHWDPGRPVFLCSSEVPSTLLPQGTVCFA